MLHFCIIRKNFCKIENWYTAITFEIYMVFISVSRRSWDIRSISYMLIINLSFSSEYLFTHLASFDVDDVVHCIFTIFTTILHKSYDLDIILFWCVILRTAHVCNNPQFRNQLVKMVSITTGQNFAITLVWRCDHNN